MALRLLNALTEHATRSPDAPALRHAGAAPAGVPETITYGALAGFVHAMAARLTPAVAEGDVVLLACPNDARFTVTFLAILAAGARAFPVSPELTSGELAAAAEHSGAAAAVGTPAALAALGGRVAHLVPIDDALAGDGGLIPARRDPGRGGLLLQSSGTTGKPKIVFRSARSLDAVAEAMCEAIGFGPTDRVLLTLPLCHSYGIEHGLLAPVTAGTCVSLSRGFDLPVVLRELTGGGITIFPGVPFMFESLARPGADASTLPALRRAYSAGGPLPRTVFDAFRERFGVAVSQLYGATEIGSVAFSDSTRADRFDPAGVGRPMRGVDVRILGVGGAGEGRPLDAGAEGQVAVRAQSMMSGYVGDDATAPLADGYFLTGDLGRLDAHGCLTLTGRLKLLIDVGGLKVNPLEVEEVLAQHPEVSACVVIPVRVSETVCRLKAIVTPRHAGGPGPSAEALRSFARGRLTPYKVPRLFEVRETLPRSPTGKVLRHLVAA